MTKKTHFATYYLHKCKIFRTFACINHKSPTDMKKFILTFTCILHATIFTGYAQSIMEPIFLSDDAEYTTQGYRVNDDIVNEIKTYYGIDNFGRVKGFDIQNAMVFTGEGELSETTDGFMFEFVPKSGTYGHSTFEAYAKALWDKCLKAADNGQIVDGSGESITFEQSIRVVDKKQDRKKCSFYYVNRGVRRRIEVIERRFRDDGAFAELFVNFERK